MKKNKKDKTAGEHTFTSKYGLGQRLCLIPGVMSVIAAVQFELGGAVKYAVAQAGVDRPVWMDEGTLLNVELQGGCLQVGVDRAATACGK